MTKNDHSHTNSNLVNASCEGHNTRGVDRPMQCYDTANNPERETDKRWFKVAGQSAHAIFRKNLSCYIDVAERY